MGKGRSSYARERRSGATNSWRGTASMAARTDKSSMPRRRSCFSIISARCGAYSLLSSMRNRRSVLFPCPGFQNFFHLRQREVAFVFAIIKMRRDAHTGFGAVIDEDFPREEFAANFVSVRAVNGNGSGALGGIFRSVDLPSARLGAGHENGGPATRLFANTAGSNFIYKLEAA